MAGNSYHRTQILLGPEQHQELSAIAREEKRSLSDVVREMLEVQLAARRRREMGIAAETLLPDYRDDAELTAFGALDGEDVK